MALKDILVHVDEGTEAAQQVARTLARAHDAYLSGLHVVSKVEFPGYLSTRIPEESVMRTRLDDAERRVDALRTRFLADAQDIGAGVSFDTALDTGVQALVDAARFVDLVVAAKVDESTLSGMPLIDIGQLVNHSPRPVLVVPPAGAQGEIGRDVMVAWDGGPKSVRAVNEALPMLETAKRVTLVAIDSAEEDRSVQGMREHLQRHGIQSEVRRIRGKGGEPADTLVSVASDLGADLVVMGAYGRGGVREMLSAGTTSRLLRTMTTPVLMTH